MTPRTAVLVLALAFLVAALFCGWMMDAADSRPWGHGCIMFFFNCAICADKAMRAP